MAAASSDDFCRCCRKLIEKRDKLYLKLFGEKSSSEGIAEAVGKYGDINVRRKSCFDLNLSIVLSFGKVYNREDSEVLQRLSQRRRKAFCSRVKEIYRRQKSLINSCLFLRFTRFETKASGK